MPYSESSAKILVADDDPGVLTLLAEILKQDGQEADAVEDAETALRLLLTNRYSLLIADVALFCRSGMPLAHEVRSRGVLLPILLLAGASDAGMVTMDVLTLRRAQLLVKPFDLAELRSAVEHVLAWPETDKTDTPTPQRFS